MQERCFRFDNTKALSFMWNFIIFEKIFYCDLMNKNETCSACYSSSFARGLCDFCMLFGFKRSTLDVLGLKLWTWPKEKMSQFFLSGLFIAKVMAI